MANTQRTARQENVIREGRSQSAAGNNRPVYRTFNALTDFTEQRRVGALSTTAQISSEGALRGLDETGSAQSQRNENLRRAMAFQEKFANAMASEDAWRQFIWDNYDLYGKFFPPSREEIIRALNSGKPFSECFADPKVVNNLAPFERDCQMVKQALTQEGVGVAQRSASPADFVSSVTGISTHGESVETIPEDVKTAREYIEGVYFRTPEYKADLKTFRHEQNAIRIATKEAASAKREEISGVDDELKAKRTERDNLTLQLNKIPEPFGSEYDDRQAQRVADIDAAKNEIEKIERENALSLASLSDERMKIMKSKSGAELRDALKDLDEKRESYKKSVEAKIKAQNDRIDQLERDRENDTKKQSENQTEIQEKTAKRIEVDAEIKALDDARAVKEDELEALTSEEQRLTSLLSPKGANEFAQLYNETYADENDANVTAMLENAGLSAVADQKITLINGKLYVLPPSIEGGDKISIDFLYTPEELASPVPPTLMQRTNLSTDDLKKEDEMFADFQNSVRADIEFDSRTRRQAARGQNFIYRNGKIRANYSALSGSDAIIQSVYGLTKVGGKLTDNKTLQEIARLKATEFIMRGVNLNDPAKTQSVCASLQLEIQKRMMYVNPDKMRIGVYGNAVNWVNERSSEIAHKTLVEMGYDPVLVPAKHAQNGFEYQVRTLTDEISFSELVNTPVKTIAPHTLTEDVIAGIAKPKIATIDAMSVSRVLYLSNMEGVSETFAKWQAAITPEKIDQTFKRDGCQKLAGLMNKQIVQLQPYVRKARKGKKFNEKEKRIVSDAVGQILAIIKNDPNSYVIKQLDRDLLYELVEVSPEQLKETLEAIGNEAGAVNVAAENPTEEQSGAEDQAAAEAEEQSNPEAEEQITPEEINGEDVKQLDIFEDGFIRDGELGGDQKEYQSPKMDITDGGDALESEERDIDKKVLKPNVEPILNRVQQIVNTNPKDIKEAKAQQKELGMLQSRYNDTMRDWKQQINRTKKQNPDAEVMEGTQLNDEIHLPAEKLFADAKRQQKERVSAAANTSSGASV